MAPRKKTPADKKAPPKKAAPRKKKAAPKKTKPAAPKATKPAPPPEANDLPAPLTIFGELFWEYRAKMAEYELALNELKAATKELMAEKQDPRYEKLLTMMGKEDRLKEQLKQYADLLRGVQVKVAEHLDVDIKTFLKDCIIDHETGVVKIFD
jgi:hypothetical protein